MAADPLTAALNLGGQLIDRFFPDPAQKAQANLALLEMAQKGELAVHSFSSLHLLSYLPMMLFHIHSLLFLVIHKLF